MGEGSRDGEEATMAKEEEAGEGREGLRFDKGLVEKGLNEEGSLGLVLG